MILIILVFILGGTLHCRMAMSLMKCFFFALLVQASMATNEQDRVENCSLLLTAMVTVLRLFKEVVGPVLVDV